VLEAQSLDEDGEAASLSQGSQSANTSLAQASSTSTHLVVEVMGVEDRPGTVIFLVFDEQSAYDDMDVERAVGFLELEASAGSLQASFPYLVDGPYAVVFFHDEDGDQDLNMLAGFPLEGYGTSGARDAYHEPGFDEAAVGVGLNRIQMHYLR